LEALPSDFPPSTRSSSSASGYAGPSEVHAMPHEETLVPLPRAPIRFDFFAEHVAVSLFLVATDYFDGIMGYCFSPCAPTGRCVPLPLKEKRPWCPAS